MYIDLAGFGAGEAIGSEWWLALNADQRYAIAFWLLGSAERQGLPNLWDGSAATIDPALRAMDRAAADGGGFVVGSECLCPPTSPGAVTQTVSSSSSCPPGTGGVGGSAPVEMTAEDVRRQLEDQRRRESTAKVMWSAPRTTRVRPPTTTDDVFRPWVGDVPGVGCPEGQAINPVTRACEPLPSPEFTEKTDEGEGTGEPPTGLSRGAKIGLGVTGGVLFLLALGYAVSRSRRRG